MSVYSVISSVLSYVFTTIIYLFIFSVIALIYMDIKKMSKQENDDSKDKKTTTEKKQKKDASKNPIPAAKCYGLLRTVKTQKAKDAKMKAAYRIDGRGVIVGRSKECDICISHMFLSLEHFQIWNEDGVWYIGDMGSKNGTYLNGSKLKKVKSIEDGDEIAFGELQFVFEEEQ